MAAVKTTTLTFPIDPAQIEALRVAAEQEHRSIAIQEPQAPPLDDDGRSQATASHS